MMVVALTGLRNSVDPLPSNILAHNTVFERHVKSRTVSRRMPANYHPQDDCLLGVVISSPDCAWKEGVPAVPAGSELYEYVATHQHTAF